MDPSLYKYGYINLSNYHSIYIDEAKAKMRPWRQKGFIREEKANHVCPNDGSERNFNHCEAVIIFDIIPSSCFFHHMSHSRARRQCQLLVGSRGGTVSTEQVSSEHQQARRSRPQAVFTSWATWEVPIQGSFPGSSEPTMAKVFFLRACQ